jgi:hypothetical protein
MSHARTYLLDKINLARRALYMLGRPFKGTTVETILKGESLIPTLVRSPLSSGVLLSTCL